MVFFHIKVLFIMSKNLKIICASSPSLKKNPEHMITEICAIAYAELLHRGFTSVN